MEDVQDFPRVYRDYEPSDSDQDGNRREWRIERNHPEYGPRVVVYADSKGLDNDHAELVTVYVQEPDKKGAGSALSKKKPDGPDSQGRRVDAHPLDTAPRLLHGNGESFETHVSQGPSGKTSIVQTTVLVKGRTNPVKTARGTRVDTMLALVEANSLIVSHDPISGNENPAFPQELQPRDRGRDSSVQWVQKVAASLDPDSLGRTSWADTGAPIIGPDHVVESGNGRSMAVKLAYQRGTADDYRQWLVDEAGYFGFTPEQVESMRQPVLVRLRTSDIDRKAFVVEAKTPPNRPKT